MKKNDYFETLANVTLSCSIIIAFKVLFNAEQIPVIYVWTSLVVTAIFSVTTFVKAAYNKKFEWLHLITIVIMALVGHAMYETGGLSKLGHLLLIASQLVVFVDFLFGENGRDFSRTEEYLPLEEEELEPLSDLILQKQMLYDERDLV